MEALCRSRPTRNRIGIWARAGVLGLRVCFASDSSKPNAGFRTESNDEAHRLRV